jgi:hypothetical protein
VIVPGGFSFRMPTRNQTFPDCAVIMFFPVPSSKRGLRSLGMEETHSTTLCSTRLKYSHSKEFGGTVFGFGLSSASGLAPNNNVHKPNY